MSNIFKQAFATTEVVEFFRAILRVGEKFIRFTLDTISALNQLPKAFGSNSTALGLLTKGLNFVSNNFKGVFALLGPFNSILVATSSVVRKLSDENSQLGEYARNLGSIFIFYSL